MMDKPDKKMTKKVEDLSVTSVVELLERWELEEFVDFVKERQLDGRRFMNITEGIVKLWRPKSNANKLVLFVNDLKNHPGKYLEWSKSNSNEAIETIIDTNTSNVVREETQIITKEDLESKASIKTIESQYQTVKKTKDNNLAAFNNVEELIKKIVPAKSFLYRNQGTRDATPSYLPMDAGTKRKKMFRISGYDYPMFDLRRFSKQDVGDRGYYPMQRNSKFFIQKSKPPDSRPKYKSLSSTEELKYPEDHFYEDLCYNEVEPVSRHSVPDQNIHASKPYRVKIQALFQSFKMPFFKRNDEVAEEDKIPESEKEVSLYENTDSIANMYDSVHVNTQVVEPNKSNEKPKLPVEEYLEPVQLSKDYCDITYQRPQKEESLLGYIMSIFENKFGIRRETNESANSEDSEDEKTLEERRWNVEHRMADRPLPVPVENEPYYMEIDRTEAENLLRGQLDGTFVLRPSSQASHAYTVSVACNNSVHNVGVRRRADGRLALGFPRRAERSFADVGALLRHHRKRRLLLVANGSVIGATTLNESPQYYQTPCNIPVKVHM